MLDLRRVVTIAAVCVIGISTLLAVPDSRTIKKASSLCQKGEQAMRAGDLAKAGEEFGKAAETVPGFPSAHLGLGHIAMAEKRFGDALEEYRNAEGGYATLGEALRDIQARRYREAQSEITSMRDSINQLSSAASKSGSAPIQIATLQNRISQLEAIQPPSDADVAEAPGELHFYVGNAYFQMGEIDKAVAAWETCADKIPKFPLVRNNLALGYMRLGRAAEALDSLKTAEDLGFPVNPQMKAEIEKAAGRS